MSISSDEVNYLIYRYLQENGFAHSAFTFGYESLVTKSSVSQVDVPPGALITFIQKGLEYVGIEEHINEDGSVRDYDGNFSLLSPFICDAVAIKEDRKQRKPSASAQAAVQAQAPAVPPTPTSTNKQNEVTKHQIPPAEVRLQKDSRGVKYLQLGGHHGEVFMCAWNPNNSAAAPLASMTEAGRRQFHQLATGSADGICRLWGLQDVSADIWSTHSTPANVVHNISLHTGVLPHATFIGEKMKDVTSISWSGDGRFLATGCYDGLARVWDCATGELKFLLKGHRESIFSVKWNRRSNHILTVSHDKRAIVWDGATGSVVRVFEQIHANAILDADWKDTDLFATCSTDTNISICSLSTPNLDVVAVLQGHTDEINAIAWSPGGRFLASCSDDTTAKVWVLDEPGVGVPAGSPAGSRCGRMKFDLRGHSKEIYTARWTPTGEGSPNPDKPLYLCTASFDGHVKVWSMETGLAVHSLCSSNVSTALEDVLMPPAATPATPTAAVRAHPLQPIYSVSSSPNGKYLAIGSQGGYVSVFELETGAMVVEEQGLGDTFDVSWSFDGELLGACFASGLVNIMNVKTLLAGGAKGLPAEVAVAVAGDDSTAAMELVVPAKKASSPTDSQAKPAAAAGGAAEVEASLVSPVKVEKSKKRPQSPLSTPSNGEAGAPVASDSAPTVEKDSNAMEE